MALKHYKKSIELEKRPIPAVFRNIFVLYHLQGECGQAQFFGLKYLTSGIPSSEAKKFKEEFDDKILTAFVNKKTQTEKVVKEKIKDETLLEASGKGGGGGKKVLTVEDIQKEQDPVKMQKILADLEKN